jgi:hypothetical protein
MNDNDRVNQFVIILMVIFHISHLSFHDQIIFDGDIPCRHFFGIDPSHLFAAYEIAQQTVSVGLPINAAAYRSRRPDPAGTADRCGHL